MKKLVKILLFGAGIAAVSFIACSRWKDAEDPVVVQDADVKPPAAAPAKEYVENQRQQRGDAAEAERAAQEVTAESSSAEVPQDSEKLKEASDTAPVKPIPSERDDEQKNEL